MPYEVHEEAITARTNAMYNGYAHSFAGMGIQFLLFAAINLGVEVLVERQRGLWKRFRSAPISRATLLGGKLAQRDRDRLARVVRVVRVRDARVARPIAGSLVGFLGVGVACAMMAASYGLLIASLGKTPNAARGASIFATLIMVMLGGAWVPTFVFPDVAAAGHGRRADALGGRRIRRDDVAGLGLESAVMPIVVLLGFAVAFTAVAVWRFRWEEQPS